MNTLLGVGICMAVGLLFNRIVKKIGLPNVTGYLVAGLLIGRKFGTKLANRAQLLGGSILIVIGIEIFLTGVLGA